jgi:acetyl-CoA acetyltransferase family protein
MREAVIVSTARTPIGKAYRGAFNDLEGPSLASQAVTAAVSRAGLEPDEADDLILGCAMQQGTTGLNVARQTVLRAGLSERVAGMTVDRQCSSGMMAIAIAAKQVMVDGMPIVIAGGVESISLVQNENMNQYRMMDPALLDVEPNMYMPMLQTAEVVAERYSVSREVQDEYALSSQQRTAAAQEAGRFDDEIVAVTTTKLERDKATGEERRVEVTLDRDEGNRPDTTAEGLSGLPPVLGGTITAGNASQLSDGASACVVMDAAVAEKRGPGAARVLPRGRSGGVCSRRDGHRAGVRRAQAAGPVRPDHRRHRPLGTQRGLRRPGGLLPGPTGDPRRAAQRRRWGHLHRTPVRDVGEPAGRSRPHRRHAAGRPLRGEHHVHRRRHGRGRAV